MKKNEKEAVVSANESVENVVVEATASVEPTLTALEQLKKQLADAAKELSEKKLQLAETMKSLKAEASALKEQEKAQKVELKKQEAETRAKAMSEALAKLGSEMKVNMTEKIKNMLLSGMTIDDMVEETGWSRKSINDRIWLIETRLGLR